MSLSHRVDGRVSSCPALLNMARTLGNKNGSTDLSSCSDKECIVREILGRYILSISQQVFIKHLLGCLAFAAWLEQVNHPIPDFVCVQNKGQKEMMTNCKFQRL